MPQGKSQKERCQPEADIPDLILLVRLLARQAAADVTGQTAKKKTSSLPKLSLEESNDGPKTKQQLS